MARLKYLLDTNALLWWMTDSAKLPKKARQVVSRPDHALYVSAATGWELATKVRIGKLKEARPLLQDFSGRLAREYIDVCRSTCPRRCSREAWSTCIVIRSTG